MRDPSCGGAAVIGNSAMKIFQIGFNKCGTSTLHRYLLANGISSVHFDGGRLAQRIFTNLANGNPLLAGYEHFDAFTDMEFQDSCGVYLEAYKLFPFFAAQYPDAVFILNTRDREAWIQSRFNHKKESYVQDHMRNFNATSNEELANYWRADWERHHLRVLEFFLGSPYRFFVCRIETDLPQLLSERLPELSLDESLFTVHNITKERLQKAALKADLRCQKLDLRSQKAALQRRNRARSLLRRLIPAGFLGMRGTRLSFCRRMLARGKNEACHDGTRLIQR
jgi:hypothetical protein